MVITMNINEVYLRIIETENDSDVVKLAKKEIMVIPILINAMLDENNCRAQNILIDLSEQTPLLVYPYFQYIIQALDRYDNFTAWNTWRIIANLLIVDYLEMWEEIKDKYFAAFNSENIAEILVVVSTAKFIIKYKPKDKEKITILASECVNNEFKICNEPAPHLNTVAKQAVDEFFNNL